MALQPSEKEASRVRAAFERLAAMAQKIGPGGQMAPIRQLRAELGVSLSTLNAALVELEGRQIIRRRQGSGIFVAPHARHRRLCLVCDPRYLIDGGGSPFWGELVSHARRRALAREETLTLHFTRLDAPPPQGIADQAALHEALADDIVRGRVDGVLSIGLTHPLTRWIEGHGVPVVSFAGPSNYILMPASEEVVREGVRELARQDCHRVALWEPFPTDASLVRQTFADALTAHGMDAADVPLPEGASLVRRGFTAMRRLLESDKATWPDGLVITDDMLTQGALMAMTRPGMRPGADIQIVSYANVGSSALLGWEDSMTRLEIDPDEIAHLMFEALGALLEGRAPDGFCPVPAAPGSPDIQPPERIHLIHPRLRRPGGLSEREGNSDL